MLSRSLQLDPPRRGKVPAPEMNPASTRHMAEAARGRSDLATQVLVQTDTYIPRLPPPGFWILAGYLGAGPTHVPARIVLCVSGAGYLGHRYATVTAP